VQPEPLGNLRRGNPGRRHVRRGSARRGAAALDYALVMGIVLPFATVTFWAVPLILHWVYEMTCVLWGWPFP